MNVRLVWLQWWWRRSPMQTTICARPHMPWSVFWINFIYVVLTHQIFEIVLYTKWSRSIFWGEGQVKWQGWRRKEGPKNPLIFPCLPTFQDPIQIPFPWSSSHNLISCLCLLNPIPAPSSTYIYVYRSHPLPTLSPSIPLCITPKPSSALHTQLSVWNDYWMKCFQLCLRGLRMVFYSPLQLLLSGSHLVPSTLTSSPHLPLLLLAAA